jgi:hypothetical protein
MIQLSFSNTELLYPDLIQLFFILLLQFLILNFLISSFDCSSCLATMLPGTEMFPRSMEGRAETLLWLNARLREARSEERRRDSLDGPWITHWQATNVDTVFSRGDRYSIHTRKKSHCRGILSSTKRRVEIA